LKKNLKAIFPIFSLTLLLIGILMLVAPATAAPTLVWEGSVSSSGEEVVSPILEDGIQYIIVVNGSWWYNYDGNLAADAQYYTTDWTNNWIWGNYLSAPPPGSEHSFLQINGADVDWGPFNNGYDDHLGHSYTVWCTGEGAALTFRIVDWVDSDYENNDCHIDLLIYKDVIVGGYVLDSNPWEASALFIIGALIFAVAVTVPIIKYSRKAHIRIG